MCVVSLYMVILGVNCHVLGDEYFEEQNPISRHYHFLLPLACWLAHRVTQPVCMFGIWGAINHGVRFINRSLIGAEYLCNDLDNRDWYQSNLPSWAPSSVHTKPSMYELLLLLVPTRYTQRRFACSDWLGDTVHSWKSGWFFSTAIWIRFNKHCCILT